MRRKPALLLREALIARKSGHKVIHFACACATFFYRGLESRSGW